MNDFLFPGTLASAHASVEPEVAVAVYLHISVREAVHTRLHGGLSHGGQRRGQKRNVALLVAGDVLQILVVGGWVACGGEVGGGELLEGIDVELVLEVLELLVNVLADELFAAILA